MIQQTSNLEEIHQRWQYYKKKLTAERGIWHIAQAKSLKIIYKIDKTEDIYRRKMRLKIDNNGPNNLYLSYQAAKQYDKMMASYRNENNIQILINSSGIIYFKIVLYYYFV